VFVAPILSLLPISSCVKSGDSRSSSHTLTPQCYQALRDTGAETGNLFKNTLTLKEKYRGSTHTVFN